MALTCVEAQDITKGSIAGIVRDASGAVVPGATVKLTSPYGDRDTTTNAAGEYGFLNLVVGPGYSRYRQPSRIFDRHAAQSDGRNQANTPPTTSTWRSVPPLSRWM